MFFITIIFKNKNVTGRDGTICNDLSKQRGTKKEVPIQGFNSNCASNNHQLIQVYGMVCIDSYVRAWGTNLFDKEMTNYERLMKYKSFNHDASDMRILRLFKSENAFILTITDSNDDLLEVVQYRFEEAATCRMIDILYERQLNGWKSKDDLECDLIGFYPDNDWDEWKAKLAMVMWYRNTFFGEKAIDVMNFMRSKD